jgi:beta-lactamase regulating signal transducer with metallopeptidase domain
MLEKIFLQVINMSYIASIVIAFILVARLLLAKAPKKYSYILWAVALVRLIAPISFESVLSLIPVNPTPISNDVLYNISPNINTGMPIINQSIKGALPPADGVASVNPMQVWIFIGSLIWILGIAIFLIYGMVSLIKMKSKFKNTNCKKDNIYQSDNVATPFVLGLLHPKIYLPASLSESEKEYIVLHEQTHIKRFDHVIRFISYLALCIHWFNPLVWIAFWLSGKDMEMSCDESVINQLGHSVKKDYSQSLLNLATGRTKLGLTPLAFGEGDIKGRIKNILNFKQPKFYILIVALAILIFTAIGLLSNPKGEEPDLSLLSITNFLSAMATAGDVVVEIEDDNSLIVSPNSDLLGIFEHKDWKEKKVNTPLEGTAVLRITLNEDYYINFYSYEDYAMIYNEDNQEKYRYYTIPKGVLDNLQSYILEYGRINNNVNSSTTKLEGKNQDASGLSDTWIQSPSKDPVEVVKSAIENQIEKNYTISVRFLEALVDDAETERQIENYKGSELADKRGWTVEYLTENFLVVEATYDVEYDHTKTFMDDGKLEHYFYLTRDIDTGLWSIIDNSSSQ